MIGTAINTETEYEIQNLILRLPPRACLPNFPSDGDLAVYGALARRVFLAIVRSRRGVDSITPHDTPYFDEIIKATNELKGEGGEGISEAADKGPNDVRELLSSRE